MSTKVYVICADINGKHVWEFVYGDDDMQVRVNVLMEEFKCDSGEIMVFDIDSQL